jgi:DNA-binding SARP family transcriptional activator
MLLSESEIATLYSEAKVKFGDLSLLELEENLAESFRKYMQKWEDLSFTSKVFETLKRFVKKLAGKTTYLEDLYHNIRTGKLANRKPGQNKSKLNGAVKQYVAVEEALPIQEQKMQEIRDKMKQVTRETSQEWTSKVVSNPALYHGDGFHMIKQSEFATREEALKAMESMGATTKEFFYPTLSNGKYYLISDQNQMLTAAAKRRAALIDEYNAAKKDMDILADYQQTADLWRQYKEVSRKQELEREIQNRPDLEAERKKKLVQEGLEMLENYRHCK